MAEVQALAESYIDGAALLKLLKELLEKEILASMYVIHSQTSIY